MSIILHFQWRRNYQSPLCCKPGNHQRGSTWVSGRTSIAHCRMLYLQEWSTVMTLYCTPSSGMLQPLQPGPQLMLWRALQESALHTSSRTTADCVTNHKHSPRHTLLHVNCLAKPKDSICLLYSDQILPFDFAEHHSHSHNRVHRNQTLVVCSTAVLISVGLGVDYTSLYKLQYFGV